MPNDTDSTGAVPLNPPKSLAIVAIDLEADDRTHMINGHVVYQGQVYQLVMSRAFAPVADDAVIGIQAQVKWDYLHDDYNQDAIKGRVSRDPKRQLRYEAQHFILGLALGSGLGASIRADETWALYEAQATRTGRAGSEVAELETWRLREAFAVAWGFLSEVVR